VNDCPDYANLALQLYFFPHLWRELLLMHAPYFDKTYGYQN